MPDIRAAQGGAAWIPVVEAAADLALTGVKATDLSAARNIARGVAALLSTTAEGLR